jgi:predicted small lipoprotein YifL
VSASSLLRLAVIGALALSFTLTACGRRGPLDRPPSAAAQPGAPPQAQNEPAADEEGNPLPAKGQRKSFFLDWLLN